MLFRIAATATKRLNIKLLSRKRMLPSQQNTWILSSNIALHLKLTSFNDRIELGTPSLINCPFCHFCCHFSSYPCFYVLPQLSITLISYIAHIIHYLLPLLSIADITHRRNRAGQSPRPLGQPVAPYYPTSRPD